jgi:exodeoxyribonuclease V gamma subunit
MPLYLYTSNRLEKLAAAFAELVAFAPLPPLTPETVVLQSGGMARWLNMRLAGHHGVSANMSFPFPNGFVGDLFGGILPAALLARKLDKRVFQWQLMRILPELLGRAEFAVLEEYLAGGRDLKRYQLAGRLADLFDQYTIFRPEMILDWEAGRGDSWQARLWRELTGRADCLAAVANRAQMQKRCLEILDRPDFPLLTLPTRVTVFGLSAIPPYYLKIFAALARHIDVHIFFLNPCREYWGDIVSARTMERLGNRHPGGEDLYLTEGNSLLASTGQQGRELLSMLLEFDFAGEFELFAEPDAGGGSGNMLTTVQADILDLREGSPQPGRPLADSDRSIMVHSCHSPMRELEVLHDQLLGMFEDSADLGPHEIIVMTPDIESYGPLIEAVFGSRKAVDGRNLPFSIADRSLKREGVLFNAFLHVLELAGSRMEASRVMAVLEKEPVRRRFALSLKELELVEKWLTAVNIRWGVDAEDRRRLGLPATIENTWRFGLDRLLLGYAMVGRTQRDFAGVLPFDDLEGGQVEALGRFLDFTTKLFTYVRQLDGKRSLAGWADLLLAIFGEFLEVSDEREGERQFVVGALTGLREVGSNGDFGGEVEFDVVMAELEEIGRGDSLTSGFMAGGITFCEMLPMRAVPFKVVCLLGMNDNAFPRPATVPAFDLIGTNPQPGDRSRRKDDRYLFLESILSARQSLYLSYIGQSVRDGGSLPPSVLVSELVEYLAARFAVGKERILTTHPLQAFSPGYFSGSGALFSYSADNCEAARMLTMPRMNRPLVSEPLPPPPEEFPEVALAELERFFSNPVRFFCRHRLGVYLEDEAAELIGTENFSLDYLDRYRLGESLLHERLTGKGEKDHLRIASQQGVMPHGSVARASFGRLVAGVDELVGRLGIDDKGDFELLSGEIEVESHPLSAQLETSPELGQVLYRYANLKGRDLIRGWLRHLFLNLLAPAGWSRTTRVIGKDKAVSFRPLADGAVILAGILALYRQGLTMPLRFFPETSLEFAVAKTRGLPDSTALFKAGRKWRGGPHARPDGDDRYCRLCYGNIDPLDDDFIAAALAFFGPLLDGSDA